METETSNIERQCGLEYEPARIEVIYISVEAGFAQSEKTGDQVIPGYPGSGGSGSGGGGDYGDEEW